MAKAVWFILGSMFVIAMLTPAHRDDPSPAQAALVLPSPPVSPTVAATASPSVGSAIALTRASDGHFYADALVNGVPVHFLVDTGATTVALSRSDAQRSGLAFADADFTSTAQGAGGAVHIKPVTLARVTIGASEALDLDAAIVDGNLGTSLLGQNWLRRFRNVSIEGDTMTIR